MYAARCRRILETRPLVDLCSGLFGLAVLATAVGVALAAPALRDDLKQPGQETQPAEPPATQAAVASATQPTEPSATQPAELPSAVVQGARQTLVSGLVGSKHDFTHEGRLGRNLCLPCHTPHLIAAPPPAFDQRAATTQPLRPYQGINVEMTGWSLLCLGCHDGVTAPDVYSSPHAVDVAGQLGDMRLGTPGLRSHPVGIRYPMPGGAYNPAVQVEAAGLPLPDGTIQCTTCHDAHNTARVPRMLRIRNDRSQMCLTCHRK